MPRALSPLDVLQKVMREKAKSKKWDEAAQLALLAAPYVHAKVGNAKAVNGRMAGATRALGGDRLNDIINSPGFGKRYSERDNEQPG